MSSNLFDEGRAILYMKVGMHAQEDLDAIIVRKRLEIERAGYSLWGYGGNTCHPTTMVQPFALAHHDQPIMLCMQPMKSNHMAEQIRAEEASPDGVRWDRIPDDINVLGSRYALSLASIDEVDETLDLAETRVAVGPSRGRNGAGYVQGRVDKACLEVTHEPQGESVPVRIRYAARLLEPYAVLLRSPSS